MARGQAGKLRRRENRSKKQDEGDALLNQGAADDNNNNAEESEALPLPPKMSKMKQQVVVETVTSDDEDEDGEEDPMPKKKNKKRIPQHHPAKSGGLKRGPLILLVILTGTTLIPAFLYASDYLGKHMPSIMGNIGYRLGFGSVPKKRVMSFYEKHAPEKLGEVPKILSNHYGEYPTLIKKLERKYQDYGYFIGWEEDEAPMRYAMDTLKDQYDVWIRYWNRHAPQILKTAFRNMRYNFTTLYKKGSKIWKKRVWPLLEPIFGVPSGVEKQKRQDAAEARKRESSSSGGSRTTRRKNRDYRDED